MRKKPCIVAYRKEKQQGRKEGKKKVIVKVKYASNKQDNTKTEKNLLQIKRGIVQSDACGQYALFAKVT